MRDLDRAAIDGHKIPSLQLMERAGAQVANVIERDFSSKRGQVVIVAGKGNNGGDGLVTARHLLGRGYDIAVLLLESSSELSPDARANWELLAPLTTHIYTAINIAEMNSRFPILAEAMCIVDAILGTGLTREVKDLPAAAIDLINSLGVPVISIDIPSGLSADDGLPLGRAIRAKTTVTFGLPKRGLFIAEGRRYAGEVEIVDIGIPKEEIDKVESKLELIEPSLFKGLFKKRKPDSHKGNYGHVSVFAGSRGHLGAGYLACLAALRAGAGLATYCIPEKAFVRFDARYAEVMCDPIPDDASASFHPAGIDAAIKSLAGKSVAVIGPAIGTEAQTRIFVNSFVKKANIPIIIDADGLGVLDLNSLQGRRHATILTPHPGEMSRLTGKITKEIQENRIAFASSFAKQTGTIVVLKGRGTIVADSSGQIAINPTGNAGMATAGMGDALTGIIASFIAQGMSAMDACMAAVYVHGLAGDLAEKEHTERALITSDVIKCIGRAIKQISDF